MSFAPMGRIEHFAALPPLISVEFDASAENAAPVTRRWNVTHACEDVQDAIPLAEAQFALGMRPALLTPNGWFHPGAASASLAPLSLVHTWREVRHWRNVFAREGAGRPGEILHAHCFSAAMAGLRAGLPVVYDVAAPLGSNSPNAGMWLLRSLRVAEGFVLSHVGAVVVHSQPTWNWALELGARAEDLFLIHHPVVASPVVRDSTAWLVSVTNLRPAVTFFSTDGPDRALLLGAFAVVAEEYDGAHLLIETTAGDAIRHEAARLDLSGRVHAIGAEDRARALSSCDVVIAAAGSTNSTAVEAFLYGRALLAADVPSNREVSPNGRGCVWFEAGSERDLAFRASFLARNADFRAALGINGRTHIQTARSPHVIARQYDGVYRHAIQRHHSGTRPDIFHGVPALACC